MRSEQPRLSLLLLYGIYYSLDLLDGVIAAPVDGYIAEYCTYSKRAVPILDGKLLDEQWVYAWYVQIGQAVDKIWPQVVKRAPQAFVYLRVRFIARDNVFS